MKLLERAAFLAVFVTMGKFFEREIGLWPSLALTLAVVFVPTAVYAVVTRKRA